MKTRYILLLLLLLHVTGMSGQIFVTTEPLTKRTGVIVHYGKTFGVYAGSSYANIRNTEFGLTHRKLCIGTSIKVNAYFYATAGYNHHDLHESYNVTESRFHSRNIHKHSFDIGAICMLTKHIHMIVLTDVPNWQTDVGIGFSF